MTTTTNGATMTDPATELAELRKQLEAERAHRRKVERAEKEEVNALRASLAEAQRAANEAGFMLEQAANEARARASEVAPVDASAAPVATAQLVDAVTLLVEVMAKVEQHTHACARALVLIERVQTLQLQIASAQLQRSAERGA